MNLISEKYFESYLKSARKDLKKLFSQIPASHPEFNDFNFYLASSATYSSNIEGNSVSFETFLKHKQFGGIAKKKEIEEIEHLILTYEFAKTNKLSLENLLVAHSMLAKNLLIKSKQGKIRKEKVGVFGERGLVYLAVEPEKVQTEMKKLFDDINDLLKQELTIEKIFYFSSFIHLVFAKIHPFMDGNGRSARLLEKWFLAIKLDEQAWNIESEKYYFKNRASYYSNIHLGPNYYEVNYDYCLPFLLMLPESLNS